MHTYTDLLQQVSKELDADTLVLPGLPEIALQVQRAVADPLMTLPKLTRIINKDPALSGRIIRIANSAWLGRPVKAENLPQAVMRLGFWQIQHVALGMALEGLYASQDEQVQRELRKNWQKTVQLTAAAITLLNHYPGEVDLHGHTLALACSSSRVGILPLLTAIERDQLSDIEEYRAAAEVLEVPLGVKILKHWNFSERLVNLHAEWREGVGSFKPSYLSFMQIAGIVTEQIKVKSAQEVLRFYADEGCITRANIWQQPSIQADYQSILSALSD